MRNAGLEETQAGIKIARRNINNLRYADDTTLKAESEEEVKSHLMKVKKESEKAGLKLNIKNKQTKKHQFFGAQPSLWSNSHSCTQLLETFVGKVMSLLFNTLSRFVRAFLPMFKSLLISWLCSHHPW